MIDILGLIKIIINIVIYYHNIPKSIVMDEDMLFTSKFWSLLYYFLGIKKKLFTALRSQTDSQTEIQNIIMESYLRAFVNWEQNN